MTKHQIEVITSRPRSVDPGAVLGACTSQVLRARRHHGKRGKDAAPISPIAFEAVKRMDALFEIERDINGLAADERLQRRQQTGRSQRRLRNGCGPSGQSCPEASSQRFST